jgi:hypothetical protein
MLHLNISDYTTINEVIDHHRSNIERNGLSIATSTDMWAFSRVRGAFGGYVHPTVDPNLNNLNSDNAFWIEVQSGNHPVACIAARLYRQERLLDLIMSRRLWHNAPCIDGAPPIPVESIHTLAMIEGDMTVQSGMFVDQSCRGMGLSTALMHLVRAASFRAWQEDWQFGLLTKETHEKNVHGPKYGYPHQTLCINGPCSWGPRHTVEYLTHASKHEILAEYSRPTSSAVNRRLTAEAM